MDVEAIEFFRSREDRLWARVDKTPDCWLWRGNTLVGGYGVMRGPGWPEKRKRYYVHRIVWALEHGPIAPGVEVCHRCDVPNCVRHLFVGTHRENMLDAWQKGRMYPIAVENLKRRASSGR